jgi:hypothetical protein
MIESFEDVRDRVAVNIYESMLDNYDPIPDYINLHKEDLLAFFKLAWVHGSNWRLNQLMQSKSGLTNER